MVDLYVGEALVMWTHPGRARRFELEGGLESALSECLTDVKRRTGWLDRWTGINVWLSGALARPFMLQAVAGLSSAAEARAMAQAAAPAATGLVGPCVVALESVPVAVPAVATAIEGSLHGLLQTLLRRHKVRARSIRPWWSRLLHDRLHQRPDTAMVCVIEPGAATLLLGQRPSLVMTVAHGDAMLLSPLMRRLCLGQGIEPARAAIARVDLQQMCNGQNIEWSTLAEAAR